MPGASLPWDFLAPPMQRAVPGLRFQPAPLQPLSPMPPLFLNEPWSRAAGQHPAFPALLPAWNAALSSLRALSRALCSWRSWSSGAPGQLCGAAATPGAGVRVVDIGGAVGFLGRRLPGSRFGILVTRAELDVGLAAHATGGALFHSCMSSHLGCVWESPLQGFLWEPGTSHGASQPPSGDPGLDC